MNRQAEICSAIVQVILLVAFACLVICGVCRADEIDDILPFVARVESLNNPYAFNKRTQAYGLYQITPIVFKEYKLNNKNEIIITDLKDLFCPVVNRIIATWYLRRLKEHYLKEDYTIERMLAAYNGGITRLRKNGYDINKMPRESQRYVKKVMRLYKEAK